MSIDCSGRRVPVSEGAVCLRASNAEASRINSAALKHFDPGNYRTVTFKAVDAPDLSRAISAARSTRARADAALTVEVTITIGPLIFC